MLLDRNTLDAPELGIELASALHKLYPNEWDMRQMILLVNDPRVMTRLPPAPIRATSPTIGARNWSSLSRSGRSICCTERGRSVSRSISQSGH